MARPQRFPIRTLLTCKLPALEPLPHLSRELTRLSPPRNAGKGADPGLLPRGPYGQRDGAPRRAELQPLLHKQSPHDVLPGRAARGPSSPPCASALSALITARTRCPLSSLRACTGQSINPAVTPETGSARCTRRKWPQAVHLVRAAAPPGWRHSPRGQSRRTVQDEVTSQPGLQWGPEVGAPGAAHVWLSCDRVTLSQHVTSSRRQGH